MPREWYDVHAALNIEDDQERELYLSILADKKPYFMRYIYPDLMKKYNTYVKNTEKKAQRVFSTTIAALMEKDDGDLTDEESEFVRFYKRGMPVGVGDCLMNRICRRIEREFDGYIRKKNSGSDFDYRIMKYDVGYPTSKYAAIRKLYNEYCSRVRSYETFSKRECIDEDESLAHLMVMHDDLRRRCEAACSNEQEMCDIILDLCYHTDKTKGFVWGICADEVVGSLLEKHGGEIYYPVKDADGSIEFGGRRFSMHKKVIGGNDGDSLERVRVGGECDRGEEPWQETVGDTEQDSEVLLPEGRV